MEASETTFVFLDDQPWPYCCRQHSDGDWWLYKWAEGPRTFFSVHKLTAEELTRYRARALLAGQANLYLRYIPEPAFRATP